MKNNAFLKIGLIVLISVVLFQVAEARISLNEGGNPAFNEKKKRSIDGSNFNIEYYIINGANAFLKSHSYIQKFFSEVEIMDLDGRDYKLLLAILDVALNHARKAEEVYILLKERANNTPYNQDFIVELVSFDYQKFELERGLNPIIFERVIEYLSLGDICGLFNRTQLNVSDIVRRIEEIKMYLLEARYPNNYYFWRLNQKYSETQLLGQYASEVFHQISRKK